MNVELTVPIEAKGLGRRYGKRWAVRGLDFRVEFGEVVGFLGQNGAGKTTTLRILVGLLRSSEGEAAVLGDSVPAGPSTMVNVGYCTEAPAFYPWLTGRQNLQFLMEPLGMTTSDIEASIDRVGLTDAADQRTREYSHGMKSRLGLARAICGRPKLVILDEPTNGLDPGWIRELRAILREIRDSGGAVFLSSHQLSEVEKSCDRVVILKKGAIAVQGSIADLTSASGWYLVDVSPERLEEALAATSSMEGQRVSEGRLKVRSETGTAVTELLMSRGIPAEQVFAEPTSLEGLLLDE